MHEHQLLATPVAADAWIRADLADAEAGDLEAVQSLHATLAEFLRAGKLTLYMIDLLAGMHESIANGSPADVAMLTKPVAGRPPNRSRDTRIHAFIAHRVTAYNYLEEKAESLGDKLPARPKMTAHYKAAAEHFGIKAAIAKAVFLRIEKQIRMIAEQD